MPGSYDLQERCKSGLAGLVFVATILLAPVAAIPDGIAGTEAPARDGATEATYGQLRDLEGVLSGLGRLGPYPEDIQVQGSPGDKPLRFPANIYWWSQMYGGRLPAALEFELTVQWGEPVHLPATMHQQRIFERAREFSAHGGLPWFRDHTRRLDQETSGDGSAGNAYARDDNILEELLTGGEHHQAFVAYYSSLAEQFKAFGRPAIFRPLHEMNGRWFWWGGQPSSYTRIWREIHAIFERHGVDNVLWCWTVSAGAEDPAAYYPGDGYVDILAIDYYSPTPEFSERFRHHLDALSGMSRGRPIILSELGIVASRELYERALPSLLSEYPGIKGVLLWWGRGWRPWRAAGLHEGSAIDWSTPPAVRDAFTGFLDRSDTLNLDRWQQVNSAR